MIHDHELVDLLSSFAFVPFEGVVFRATRKNQDPLTPSVSGGRWAAKNTVSVLYTSREKEGAVAELAFHWSQFNPPPSGLANLHRIAATAGRTVRLIQTDLESLGVEWGNFGSINNVRTQQIGAALAFLECDGLIAPSARWACDNLILFLDNHQIDQHRLEVIETEEIDWLSWARRHMGLSIGPV